MFGSLIWIYPIPMLYPELTTSWSRLTLHCHWILGPVSETFSTPVSILRIKQRLFIKLIILFKINFKTLLSFVTEISQNSSNLKADLTCSETTLIFFASVRYNGGLRMFPAPGPWLLTEYRLRSELAVVDALLLQG